MWREQNELMIAYFLLGDFEKAEQHAQALVGMERGAEGTQSLNRALQAMARSLSQKDDVFRQGMALLPTRLKDAPPHAAGRDVSIVRHALSLGQREFGGL